MSLIVIVIIVQAVSSTLVWLGFYVGIRWRREHAIANTAKPAVPGSDNVPISATSRGQWLEF